MNFPSVLWQEIPTSKGEGVDSTSLPLESLLGQTLFPYVRVEKVINIVF